MPMHFGIGRKIEILIINLIFFFNELVIYNDHRELSKENDVQMGSVLFG